MYLSKDDIQSALRDETLAQLLDNSDDNSEDVFPKAVKEACALVMDHTIKYEIEAELQKQGDERHGSIIFHAKNIVIYILYQRVPDDQVPERVVKDYNDTMAALIAISKNKTPLSLPVKKVDTDGDGIPDRVKTKFRFGGESARKYS